MLDTAQGRDTSVRGTISKGRFVQGAQHPRIFGQGHIGRGHINPASRKLGNLGLQTLKSRPKPLPTSTTPSLDEGRIVQETHPPRDVSSMNFRSGTQRSEMNLHCTFFTGFVSNNMLYCTYTRQIISKFSFFIGFLEL